MRLTDFDLNLSMQHPTSLAMFDHWDRLCAGRPVPLRSELDPAAIRTYLPDLYIFEQVEPGIFRFRLAGTRVCLLFGKEIRQEDFQNLWHDDSLTQVQRLADAVLQSRLPAFLQLGGHRGEDCSLSLEMLMMPLASSDGSCARVLGSLVAVPRQPLIENAISKLSLRKMQFLSPDIRATIRQNRLDALSACADQSPSAAKPACGWFGRLLNFTRQ